MSARRRPGRRHRLLVLAFLLAAAVTVFFGVRMTVRALYWSDPAHSDQAVAGWMTPRYVARSWDVPPEVIAEALGVPLERPRRPLTLEDIASAQGESVEAVAARVEAAIDAYRSAE
ncbi:hypothetical protein [Oceanibium sediminis]|uniref:hypothetical protein n=1 Tax=Oceanibium sediminis TaxID=2026339 RepID=UPI001300A645|nr:hypothetical protein [Oceanibium sediminis]